ncbi:unnamed protein product [Natator depressus]
MENAHRGTSSTPKIWLHQRPFSLTSQLHKCQTSAWNLNQAQPKPVFTSGKIQRSAPFPSAVHAGAVAIRSSSSPRVSRARESFRSDEGLSSLKLNLPVNPRGLACFQPLHRKLLDSVCKANLHSSSPETGKEEGTERHH